MKTRIVIYGFLILLVIAGLFFAFIRRPALTGLSIGNIKRNVYEGSPSNILANEKGFVFAANTTDRIIVTQTDYNGKTIFSSRDVTVNRDAKISKLSLATNPSGSRSCVVWEEDSILYYRFIDVESGLQNEAVKIGEFKAPLSFADISYNSNHDEFQILYNSKLTVVDSLGYSKDIADIPIKITSERLKVQWNESDQLYTAVAHLKEDNFRFIQFDNNGNAAVDKDFVVEGINEPKDLYIIFNPDRNEYNVFISQLGTVSIITLDNQAYILHTRHIRLSQNFNGEFSVIDNGQCYDVIYCDEVKENIKRIIHIPVPYEVGDARKYTALAELESYTDVNPSLAISNNKLGILYASGQARQFSNLIIAVSSKETPKETVESNVSEEADTSSAVIVEEESLEPQAEPKREIISTPPLRAVKRRQQPITEAAAISPPETIETEIPIAPAVSAQLPTEQAEPTELASVAPASDLVPVPEAAPEQVEPAETPLPPDLLEQLEDIPRTETVEPSMEEDIPDIPRYKDYMAELRAITSYEPIPKDIIRSVPGIKTPVKEVKDSYKGYMAELRDILSYEPHSIKSTKSEPVKSPVMPVQKVSLAAKKHPVPKQYMLDLEALIRVWLNRLSKKICEWKKGRG